MPLKLLLDENLVSKALLGAIAGHGLPASQPLDIAMVGIAPAPPKGTSDSDLIAWAATENRIMVSRDTKTLPSDVYDFVAAGNRSPGVIILRRRLSLNEIVGLFYLVSYSSSAAQWENSCQWLP